MTDETRPGVHEFFEAYRAAFVALNTPAITELFTYPLHITGESGEISLDVIENRDDWSVQVEGLLELYRKIGFASAHILDLTVTELSLRVAQAVVHWRLEGRAGSRLYDFKAMYTLVRMNGSLRIVAIAHDELPKIQACLERLKSGRT